MSSFEAIRFVDVTETVDDGNGNVSEKVSNYKGVYIRKGEQILFKRIEVVYEGTDYVLSKPMNDDEYLALYDDILIEEVEKNEK